MFRVIESGPGLQKGSVIFIINDTVFITVYKPVFDASRSVWQAHEPER